MKVLIVDNTMDRDSWGSASLRSFVTNSPDRTAFVRRAPQSDIPESPKNFDRIILSGSRTSCLEEGPWIAQLDQFLKEALSLGKPILGICYGHQALNRVLGGKTVLRKAPKAEFGWTKIQLIERAPLFAGLTDEFWTFSSHHEEVASLPKGMRHLAQSTDCLIQACRHEDLPVYGIQFHPEKSLESTKQSIQLWKKDRQVSQILHEKSGDKLYDPKIGDTIFENFLS